jgi:hypothetical protein
MHPKVVLVAKHFDEACIDELGKESNDGGDHDLSSSFEPKHGNSS